MTQIIFVPSCRAADEEYVMVESLSFLSFPEEELKQAPLNLKLTDIVAKSSPILLRQTYRSEKGQMY